MAPIITNKCSNLSSITLWHIRTSLKWISPLDLLGVKYIVLLDKPASPDADSAKSYKEAYFHGFTINGEYFKQDNDKAIIYLYVKEIYRAIPYWANFSPMPTLYFAHCIAHEVGHHLIRTRGYIFTPDEKYPDYSKTQAIEEEMANRYAFSVESKMKKKIWYKFGAFLMNYISDGHYISAMLKWKEKRYREAADYWYKSFLLNSERQESVQWYWNSIEKLESIQRKK